MFFGTPVWAVPSLDALIASGDVDLAGVVTNPDRPAGRGMSLRSSPVKVRAAAAGLEVVQPATARDPDLPRWLRDREADVAVVVAYGKILPGTLLEVVPHGFVNVHFSLLPEYRGAAPVQRAIVDGRDETGISIMVLTEGMDEGPVLAATRIPIEDDDTAGSLGDRLADVGAALLAETLPRYVAGGLEPQPQDHASATYAPKVTAEEARIDWSTAAARIRNLVRGLNPAPGAWTTLEGKRLKVHSASLARGGERRPPGRIAVSDEGITVGTGDAPLALEEVQLEGRRRMSGTELGRGIRIAPDTTLS